jgi:hypothetical protein
LQKIGNKTEIRKEKGKGKEIKKIGKRLRGTIRPIPQTSPRPSRAKPQSGTPPLFPPH